MDLKAICTAVIVDVRVDFTASGLFPDDEICKCL